MKISLPLVLDLRSLTGYSESAYNKNMTNEQAKEIATKAVAAAMERDPGSGNGIDVLVIPHLVTLTLDRRK